MKIKENKIYKELTGFIALCGKKRLDTYSAATAFYVFMSLIPFLLIILSTIKYLPFSKQDFLRIITDLMPGDSHTIITYIIDEMYEHGIGALSVSIFAALWASAKGVFGIAKGLNDIFEVNKERTGYWYTRIRSAVCTMLLMFGMVLMLVISVFGNTIINIVNSRIAIPPTVINLLEAKNIIMFAVLFTVFMFFFCVLPGQRMQIASQVLVAAAAAFIWIMFTKIFSFYLSTFKGYSMYGSFAVVIITGVWVYAGMYIMFMGALFNKVTASRKGNDYERQDQ